MSSVHKTALKSLSRRRNIERSLSNLATLAVIPGVCALLGAFTPDIHKDYGTNVVIGKCSLAKACRASARA